MKKTKRALLLSVISLLACFAMLIGSTFAWFTDSVSSMNNIITSGNLDLKMYWTDDLNSGVWYDVEDDSTNTIFGYDNWEPGYTQVRYIKLVNAGSLALDYRLAITPQGEVGKLAEVITVHYAGKEVALNDRSDLSKLNSIGLLDYVMSGTVSPAGTLLPADEVSPFHDSGETIVTLAMSMLTTAGNEYQSESVGKGFTITAVATQAMYETDSFGDDYDEYAEFPAVVTPSKVTVPVTNDNGVLAADTTMSDGIVSATLPAGVKLADGATEATLTVTLEKTPTSGITAVNDEKLIPLDVHIEGVAEDNTVPIIIDLGPKAPKGLNMGNYVLYHVEDGVSNAMTYVADVADLNAHNQFTYDAATGNITVAMASFSHVEILADTAAQWSGKEPTAEECKAWFADGAKAVYTIANADELNIFSRIVGGMWDRNGDGKINTDDCFSFKGKTVELLTDINLADSQNYIANSNPDVSEDGRVFYPIGAYNNAGKFYDKYTNEGTWIGPSVDSVVDKNGNQIAFHSSLAPFEGTFDGKGCTIANFYQQTWEMFGDYDANHYKDGMGLFGWVNGGTVKNLAVDNFSSDGEFTPTGVIAAFADNATFENIAITNCNPRVYNTGNGGIVGIGGTTGYAYDLTFKNITVNGTNKITALWGSWDVACGGIVGMFRGTGKATMENCYVAAQIDVYNDVCGNYQYYRYRYAGMLIGTIFEMTNKDGKIIPRTDLVHPTNCYVSFENWNDYYYCELVANSLASYTHDHQMSRLTEVKAVEGTTITYLNGTTGTVPASGRYNYVVRKDASIHSTENAECYHFVDGKVWNHEDAGKETVGGKEVLKEDNQHIYLPFNQLMTGYGWGVEYVPIDPKNNTEEFGENVKILDPVEANSVTKFEFSATPTDNYFGAAVYDYDSNKAYPLSTFFEAVADSNINSENVYVAVIPVYGNEYVAKGSYSQNAADWKSGTVTFDGKGEFYLVITDYNNCNATTSLLISVDGAYAQDVELEW